MYKRSTSFGKIISTGIAGIGSVCLRLLLGNSAALTLLLSLVYDLNVGLSTPKNRLASPERFELPTHGLEGRCSIQLSYGQIIGSPGGIRTRIAL